MSEPPRLADLRRIGEGREAEIFAWDEGRALRLLRDAAGDRWAERQAVGLAAAWEGGAPVPKPYEQLRLDGRPGIVMDRADGPDMLTDLGRRPWTVVTAGRRLGRIHARINDVVAPSRLPSVRADLRERIDAAGPELAARHRDAALAALGQLPDGDRLCHGDFHPANVIVTARGPLVIDWTNAARGDPTSDVARCLLALQLGEPPPGVSVVIRIGATFGRSLMYRSYLGAYQRRTPVPDGPLRRWQMVHAAARFAEGIEGEYPALTRLLERHARS